MIILKQFLKPDWRKIVIFVIILIIGFLIPILPAYCDISPFAGMCAPGTTCNFKSIGLMKISDLFKDYGARNYCGIITYDNNVFYQSIVFIVIDMIFYYLLSCFIVWIYDKFRKKK
jgi:hypothetical protein